jgi:hypothetical protein
MAPGARKFETLHSIKGDSLYRVATSEQGEVLATWEKDPSIHYFTRDGRHVVLPQPSSPREGINRLGVEFLGFLPNGREALVHMDGNELGKSTQYDVTFRITLDGSKPPEPVVQMVSARQIDMNAQRAVYVLPKKAGLRLSQPRSRRGGRGLRLRRERERTAENASQRGRAVGDQRAHGVGSEGRAAHRRPGDAKAEVRPITRSSHGEPRFYALASGAVIETNVDYDEGLTITRHGVDGSRHVTAVPVLADPDNYDHHLWVRIDSTRSRDFVRLDLADADKRAKPVAQQKVAHE